MKLIPPNSDKMTKHAGSAQYTENGEVFISSSWALDKKKFVE